ncbi:sulfate permease [Arsenicicoccus bolidensis]|uniref:Sulfate permease n=1 Tax=Arsenicicoccus bolidensis TaxID=229480 RepID=A0ABS9Q1U3_9MICO|nr:sulfate permease [Arsenicicoccus bolidensis]MCG7321058.1 sulfate permease [Arsenicicoccus bolidensis]
MPTNRLLDAIRTRRGLKWGIPAMLLAIPYLLAAAVFRDAIEGGGPACLNLLVLLCIWNAVKLTIVGPVSAVLLIHARATERVERRRGEASEAFRAA